MTIEAELELDLYTPPIITLTPGFGEVVDTGWELRFYTKNSIKALLGHSKAFWYATEEEAKKEEERRNAGLRKGRWIAVHTGERI
ncbi:hypothetical protein SEA_SIXAMA_27 [Gordonia phage Sixama]|uniref:Uncharacterized protein n=1 Tax=Gordonia phage Sixama TaxID=2653271 RepID=A0A5Q2F7T8_9CAUD|nr:hypothetical protein PP302_gp027 [Gordonia phage Sixama]QGF20206.1 hypothetical protein SEA_SIXAMA_27 [Gordonia phage Sixama]